MEDLMLTFRELLRNEWLSWTVDDNSNAIPGVLGRGVKAWWHGDREVITANDLPAIVIDSTGMTPDWTAFRTQEHEHNFDILCYVRETDADDSKTVIHEMARLIQMVVQDQSRWWAFHECFFDKELFYSPQYLIDNYGSILLPYTSDIVFDYETDWNAQHKAYDGIIGSGPSPQDLSTNDLYVAAYLKLFYEDPLTASWATTDFDYTDKYGTTYTTTPKDLILLARSERIVPARFISDSKIKNINYGYVYKGAELLYGAQISMYAKEHWPITNFGPI